ncbi:MAG: PadR family transcriptional regulator [Bacteroidota bacterium]
MSPELLKGTLTPLILKLLLDRGRMYGYEITQQVKLISRERILLKEGTLYPALYKLLADGLITAEEETAGGRARRYYSLTQAGYTRASEQINLVNDFLDIMREMFTPQPRLGHADI